MIYLAVALYDAALTVVLGACYVAGGADDAMDQVTGDLPNLPHIKGE